MVEYGVINKKMILVQEGTVEMSYKNSKNTLLIYEEGSYFGEISYLFDVKNFYRFKQPQNKKSKIYSL